MTVQFLNCGDTAFTVQFGDAIDPAINGRVMGLHAAIKAEQAAGRLGGVVETVPTIRSLMVVYDPLATSRAELQPSIEALIAHGLGVGGGKRHVHLPCCYDDPDFAPDLAEVAAATGLSAEAVVERHLQSVFTVYVLGFMPGLAYMAGLDPALRLPRRTSPRVRVPQSTVAIAMEMTTVYPWESPGGWHLIGRTPVLMFDKRRPQPVTLQPGDEVRFERIDRPAYDRLLVEVEAGRFDPASLARAA
jgi:KipI family sensor histidine kinase inhibitor